jgi:hypothetical protein
VRPVDLDSPPTVAVAHHSISPLLLLLRLLLLLLLVLIDRVAHCSACS